MADLTLPLSNSTEKPTNKKILGITSLIMINVAAALSLRNFPIMAMEGWNMIFWYGLFTTCFLVPTALVAAELASTWPRSGGIYSWVKEAYPNDGSFIAIWCAWLTNIVWLPTILSFFAATVAYLLLAPQFSGNPVFLAIVMLACLWGVTIFNSFGARASKLMAGIGIAFGSLIPVSILAVLMIAWIFKGNPSAIGEFSFDCLIPKFNLSTLPFAASLVLMFAGIEIAGYYARDTKNMRRDYPIALFSAAAIICIVSIIGTLSVALVVPAGEICLATGVVQTFQTAFENISLKWLIIPITIMIALGTIAQLSMWISGPSKGLVPAAMSGDFPPFCRKLNKYGVPVGILFIQGIVSSLLTLAMVLVPSFNDGYWILTSIASLITVVMYMFLFAAFFKLRRTKANVIRPYKVPGGKIGMWLVTCVASVVLFFAFSVGLFPIGTSYTMTGAIVYAISMLTAVLLIILLPPYLLKKCRKDSWKPTKEEYCEWDSGEQIHETDTTLSSE
ncbi:MAG: amino acid permease [Methanocalculaceae archaeon]|jgi:amino acid transporter|nr:amino acid permease [Methanocalculaceae archaeon]